jgi:hypothetical protein
MLWPMLIELALGLEDIVALLREATPLRIHLTDTDEDRRWVEIEPPSDVALVPHVGLRVVSHGRIRYELAGLQLPFTIRRLQILFEPVVVSSGAEERLDFKLSIEQADLELVPSFGERALINAVNEALEPARLGMLWPFGRLLERALPLPARFEPLRDFLLQGPMGTVSVTANELRFRLNVDLGFSRSKPRPTDD